MNGFTSSKIVALNNVACVTFNLERREEAEEGEERSVCGSTTSITVPLEKIVCAFVDSMGMERRMSVL